MAAAPTVYERRRPAAALVDHLLGEARQACFWIEDVGDPGPPELLRGDHRGDLVVVGGGFAGLWTAVRAKERDPGRHVVLLEGERLGWAASGRNGGFCSASLTHGYENGRSRWPDEIDTLERMGRENLDGIECTVREHGLDADFERTGNLAVAVEPHQVAWLQEAAAAGHGRFLDEAAVRAEVNGHVYLAGIESHDTALVHPAKLVRALAGLARSLGVEIFEHARVTRVDADGRRGPVRVELDRGRVVADRVALATNVFPSLVRRYRLHTVPVYDYVLMTEPLPADVLADIGWRRRQGVDDLANQFHYYRLSADDRLLFGGYDAIYHPGRRVRPEYERRPETFRRLGEHLLTTFPQLAGVRVTHQWAGAIDTCTRFCAFYGTAHRGRVAHAAGFTGLGVGASRFAADVMLDLLDGAQTERTSLEMVRRAPLPFPPDPLARAGIDLTRWSLVRADRRQGERNLWLRTLDRCGLGFDS
ncbi:FAD-dependent oxidoreductase [Nocardioides ginsengisoli]|uniref:NAD(P)/FAD-dependent oxidoreductase n=1 Tax=Nocardioides ginsengisoli TaxID=363868 RepID=A0ABW3W7H2_9ACTN